eukprot:PhF_6_TR8525/c0_g1_i1/m.13357
MEVVYNACLVNMRVPVGDSDSFETWEETTTRNNPKKYQTCTLLVLCTSSGLQVSELLSEGAGTQRVVLRLDICGGVVVGNLLQVPKKDDGPQSEQGEGNDYVLVYVASAAQHTLVVEERVVELEGDNRGIRINGVGAVHHVVCPIHDTLVAIDGTARYIMALSKHAAYMVDHTTWTISDTIRTYYDKESSFSPYACATRIVALPSDQGAGGVILHDVLKRVHSLVPAHKNAIRALAFDSSGLNLFTASSSGTQIHMYAIYFAQGGGVPKATLTCSLHRGYTTGFIHSISVSPSLRWVAVSTAVGTTHVFCVDAFHRRTAAVQQSAGAGGSSSSGDVPSVSVTTRVRHSGTNPVIRFTSSTTSTSGSGGVQEISTFCAITMSEQRSAVSWYQLKNSLSDPTGAEVISIDVPPKSKVLELGGVDTMNLVKKCYYGAIERQLASTAVDSDDGQIVFIE